MKSYKYILDPSSRKDICPSCGKKRFVRYVDTTTGEYLPGKYGRCDREQECSYHSIPNDHKQETSRFPIHKEYGPIRPAANSGPVLFPFETFKQTLKGYNQNTFIQNLLHRVPFPFTASDVEKVISMYYIGTVTNGDRAGGITFPFIDISGNVRAVQVKQFDQSNHTTSTDFLHSIIFRYYQRNGSTPPEWLKKYSNQEKKISCLFGEHLLKEFPNNPVALVEAPKTAVCATLYFGYPDSPQDFIWLAVYNKSSFKGEKLKVLNGRNVYVFPDLSKKENPGDQYGRTFNEWKTKADEISHHLPGMRFVFSDFLEQKATEAEREQGKDIADYLVNMDWRNFRKPISAANNTDQSPAGGKAKPHNKDTGKPPQTKAFSFETNPAEPHPPEPEPNPNQWDEEIQRLERIFNERTIPRGPIWLNEFSRIIDGRLFVNSHLEAAKANKNKLVGKPYLERLQAFSHIISNN